MVHVRAVLSGAVAIAIAGVLLIPTAASAEDSVTAPDPVGAYDYESYATAYDDFVREHPWDVVGRARVAAEHGVVLESISFPAAGIGPGSPDEVQAQVDAQRADPGVRMAARTFEDRFTVSAAISTIPSSGETVIQGDWNFDDAFAGGLGPRDLAALQWTAACFTVRDTRWNIADYSGQDFHGLGTIYSADANGGTTVLAIDDTVSGFKTNYDNGNLRVFGHRKCTPQASFQYEHNQGENASFSLGVGFGLLSVSYNGPGVERGQRSSGIVSV